MIDAGGGGWLRSDREYEDFVLKLEVRWLKPRQDSGIFLRASKEGKNWPDRRYEVQCENSQRVAMIFGAKHTIDAKKAFALLKEPKEWNTFEIRCAGKRCGRRRLHSGRRRAGPVAGGGGREHAGAPGCDPSASHVSRGSPWSGW